MMKWLQQDRLQKQVAPNHFLVCQTINFGPKIKLSSVSP